MLYFAIDAQDSNHSGVLRDHDKFDQHRRQQVFELHAGVVRRDTRLPVELADNGGHVQKNVPVVPVHVDRRFLRHVQHDARQ